MISFVVISADADTVVRPPAGAIPADAELVLVLVDRPTEPALATAFDHVVYVADVSAAAAANAGLMAAHGDRVVFFTSGQMPQAPVDPATAWPEGLAAILDPSGAGPSGPGRLLSAADVDGLVAAAALVTGGRRQVLFDSRALRAVGGLDSRLGSGTHAHGASQLDVLLRLLRSGYSVLLQDGPSSVPDTGPVTREPPPRRRSYLDGVVVGSALDPGTAGRQLAGALLGIRTDGRPRSGARAAGVAAGMLAGCIARQGRRPDLPAWSRIWSGSIDLDRRQLPIQPLLSDDGAAYDRARFLVRASHATLGFVELTLTGGRFDPEDLDRAIASQIGSPTDLEPRSGPATGTSAQAQMTVAVCTRNRAESLSRCLTSLTALGDDVVDILVVDNAPTDASTEDLVRAHTKNDSRVRYALEPEPGLSRARNRAIAESANEIIAFTDDDVVVDPGWCRALDRGFARAPDVACVTGLVASTSLETAAEQYFDQRVWWSARLTPRIFRRRPEPTDPGAYPFTTGAIGTGANVAFRRSTLVDLGGFDEALGAGTLPAGGEDLDIFARLLLAERAISYEPDAVVWHGHRVDSSAARRQLRGYGSGLSAYMVKYLLSPSTRSLFVRRLLASAVHALLLSRRARHAQVSARAPRGFASAEMAGLIAGPSAYLRSRRQVSPARQAAVQPR